MNQRGLSAKAVEKLRSKLVLCRCSSNTDDGRRAYYTAISALDAALAAQDAPEPAESPESDAEMADRLHITIDAARELDQERKR